MSTTRSEDLTATGGDPITGYVLPTRRPGPRELLVSASPPTASEPRAASPVEEGGLAEVARSIGSRFASLAACQRELFTELRACLEEVDETVAEAARVRLQVQVRTALSVLGWCDAVQADLQAQARWAEQGLQPIDLIAFCEGVARREATAGRRIDVTGTSPRAWWGRGDRLGELIVAGIGLLGEVTGATAVGIEVGGEPGTPEVRIFGTVASASTIDPAVARTFRRAAERLGAAIRREDLAPGGSGLVLGLPCLAVAPG